MIGKADSIYTAKLLTWDAGLSILNTEGRDAVRGAFQSVSWLKAWNVTIGRSAGWPFMITVRENRNDNLVAVLPLLLRRVDRCQIVAWADCGVSDYNAPILGAAAPADAAGARAMWRAVKKVLPPADVVKFTKMPVTVEGRRNPLTLLPQARASVCGHTLVIASTWDSYLEGLERRFRKELRRSWRVFTKDETAAFVVIDSDDEARRVLTALESQQNERFKSTSGYLLDRPERQSFYRELTANGIRNGEVMLSALTCRGEVVSALLGLVSGSRYVMVRISADHARWSHCSPGRLIITETLRHLHERGFTIFDFSIGDYAYKRRLGVKSDTLFEFTNPISAIGLASTAYDRAKKTVIRYPRLKRIAQRLLKAKPN
jgi:CelD/BcsL family acetyltransferase involved in cellulose biosynthesis